MEKYKSSVKDLENSFYFISAGASNVLRQSYSVFAEDKLNSTWKLNILLMVSGKQWNEC